MSLPGIVPQMAKSVGPSAPTLHKFAAHLARPWMLLALDARYALRRQLMRQFPLTYEIVFTPGNLDERLFPAIAGHRRLKRLLDQPGLAPLRTRHPEILYRPYRRYLASSFGKSRRRAALLHH